MIIASHRSGKVSFVSMEQDAFTVAYSSYEKSDLENLLHPSSGTLNKETSPKGIGTPCYELYSWHECSTPFDQIKLQQNWLTIRCVEMATLKPIKKQSMAHRIFRRWWLDRIIALALRHFTRSPAKESVVINWHEPTTSWKVDWALFQHFYMSCTRCSRGSTFDMN